MNATLKLGTINKLKIDRSSDHGLYLVTNNGEEDVLLPQAYVTDKMQIGEEIDVFLYTDSEDRIVATTKTPKAMLGEFGLFEVVDTTDIGAFVDWGLSKDLFVPKSVQKTPYQMGKKYILRVAYDAQTERLFGDSRIGRYLEHDSASMRHLKVVDIFIIAKTPLGFKVIANNLYEGMIFSNEIFETVNIGDHKKGYIKKVRDDGKFDISLQPIGADREAIDRQKIITLLNDKKHLPFNYKSDAEVIKKMFGLSKKSFKKVLTSLQNDEIITIDDSGITLK
ncbi:MAG: DNA-binding protein [Epsilonproteobacteria bacterium]|nr:DNA-binding protein [Campylobacterota bacterium]